VEVTSLGVHGSAKAFDWDFARAPLPTSPGEVVEARPQGTAAAAALLEVPATFAQLQDPAFAAAFLEAVPQIAGTTSGRLRCEVIPLKVRERRGTGVFLYKLHWAGPAGPGPASANVVGKITSARNRSPTGEKAFAVQRELWNHGFSSGRFRVPSPIAYIRPSAFMITGMAPGTDLITLFREGSDRLKDGVRLAALWLARLHATYIECVRARPVERQMNKIERVGTEFEFTFPTLSEPARALRKRIAAAIAGAPEASLTVTHGDYLLKNLIVHGDTITAIDFEESGMFDPAKDVGKFVANLEVKGDMHKVRFDVGELSRLFLETYAARSGSDMGDRIAAYHALSLLKHARRQATAAKAAAWLDAAGALFEEARP
jgi:aminoglycoside phosphotransferase